MTPIRMGAAQRHDRPLQSVALVVLLAWAIGACRPQAPDPKLSQSKPTEPQHGISTAAALLQASGGPVRVVATTSIVADVVQQIGGDHIVLTRLIDVGLDPHTYVPTPADTAAVHDAHVVFASGAGLEVGLADFLSAAGGDAVQVHLSDELPLLGAKHLEGQATGKDAGHDDAGDQADPHVWFDVQNVILWVDLIEKTLSSLDPSSAVTYAANGEQYRTELRALDTWVASTLAEIPVANRKLVTNHPSFGYLASRYDLQQFGAVYPLSPSSQPSARDIAGLEDLIRTHSVPAIFTESTVDSHLAAQVAQDTGVTLVPLYSGSIGQPGSGAETYVDMIRYDVSAITNALK